MGTAGLPASLPGISYCLVCMLINPVNMIVFKVFSVVDFGKWLSVVGPIGLPKGGAVSL